MNRVPFILAGLLCLGLLLVGFVYLWEYQNREAPIAPLPGKSQNDPLSTTYRIDGDEYTLVNGRSEEVAAPGSASKISTTVFGQPTYGDLDADGDEDAGVMLVQDSGGSGTFFYLAAAVNGTDGFKGTNAVLLGDRIAPQTLELRNGVLIANYADRASDEPMAAQPSVGVSKYAILKNGALEEVFSSDKSALIRITSPLPGATVKSPITVIGMARGVWYFEATFPLVLVDWDGRIIAEGYVTAEDEWMTEEFVPFRGTLEFVTPEDIGPFSKRGALILRKDNPSGLPEHDDALEIPIWFEQ